MASAGGLINIPLVLDLSGLALSEVSEQIKGDRHDYEVEMRTSRLQLYASIR
jgi:hypothetical protein